MSVPMPYILIQITDLRLFGYESDRLRLLVMVQLIWSLFYRSFSHSGSSIVFVTTNSLIGDDSIFSMAFPVKTG